MVGSNPNEGVLPPDAVKKFDLSSGRLELHNGSIAQLFSAATQESVEKIRGSASGTTWIEELAAMAFADSMWNTAIQPADRPGPARHHHQHAGQRRWSAHLLQARPTW